MYLVFDENPKEVHRKSSIVDHTVESFAVPSFACITFSYYSYAIGFYSYTFNLRKSPMLSSATLFGQVSRYSFASS